MKKYTKIFGLMFAAVCIVSMIFSACRKEMPEVPVVPPEPDTTYDEYNDDSTGVVFSDSIMVSFDSMEWNTLEYTSRVIRDTLGTNQEWIEIKAHYPGEESPKFTLTILNEIGSYMCYVNTSRVVTPVVTFTKPGDALYGDKCSNLKYFSNDSVLHSPDGTLLADWWVDTMTFTVKNYDLRENRLTASCVGKMFNYREWFNASTSSPVNVEDVERKNIVITLGNLHIDRD